MSKSLNYKGNKMEIEIEGKLYDTEQLRKDGTITLSDDTIRKRIKAKWDIYAAVFKPFSSGNYSDIPIGHILEIRKLYEMGHDQKRIAGWFGICQSTISRVVNLELD